MKPIANYENRYSITETGDVYNHATGKFLTPIKNPNGYLKVGLANGDGTQKQISIHQLVAMHYIPNPYRVDQINHIDGDKTNNCVRNLEWVTAKSNVEHAFKTGLRKGYMSFEDKYKYLTEVLNGTQINDIAIVLGRRPETLHKMLRECAKSLGIHDQWQDQMKKNRTVVAIRNLEKVNGN